MEHKDYQHIVNCFKTWLKHKYDKNESLTATGIIVDLKHSNLLNRLIENKTIYDAPPPLTFSYPWYELLDEGKGEAEIWFPNNKDEYLNPDDVVINQTIWKLIQKISDKEYIVSNGPWKCKVTITNDSDPEVHECILELIKN